MIIEQISQPLISVSSTINSDTFLQKAEELAAKHSFTFIPRLELCGTELILCYTETGLKLISNTKQPGRMKTLLFVDFVHGKNGYRLAKNCTIKQPLARAVGIKTGKRPTIFDATAGLGGDSFVLASLGCKVTLSERNPVMFTLLEDGLERARNHQKTSTIVSGNIKLIQQNSQKYLEGATKRFETIYLDPMYPHRESSALGKESMRTIRSIVGDDYDADSLFSRACENATSRVSVKRPKMAPTISQLVPDHVISMKSSRFDIYFPKR